jgi:hypothetical protein
VATTAARLPGDRRIVVRVRGLLVLSAVEGVLPLHMGTSLSRGHIGLLYAAMSVFVAIASVLTARLVPGSSWSRSSPASSAA